MKIEIRILEQHDDRSTFRSGNEALDLYLHRYAGQNQFRHHIGVTYVAVAGERILGFATVTPATLDVDALPMRMGPYPVPVLRIARLAVDERVRETGIGQALLRFCLELALEMKKTLGCVGVVVDAKQESVDFYHEHGFMDLDVVEGRSRVDAATVCMFLPVGSVPRKG